MPARGETVEGPAVNSRNPHETVNSGREIRLHPHDAQKLARELMRRHGLFDAGWRFRFDHARRRFGCCRYGPKLITLSRPLTLLNAEPEVRDTLLHEIAHALCPGASHGPRWRTKCRELGAKPRRCYSDETVASPPRRPAPYEWGCGSCGWWVERRRRTRGNYICAKCRGRLAYRMKWDRGHVVTSVDLRRREHPEGQSIEKE